jgi:uncharacterized membrane protein YhaH (DUF805 family)/putative flippase GtrA
MERRCQLAIRHLHHCVPQPLVVAMNRLTRLLRFWFTFDEPVPRRAYLTHGAALMALKYVVDATLILAFAGRLWTPWDYLVTGADVAHSKLAGAPGALLPLLGLWTLPFLWIGLTMTLRRALDAGQSAWIALLFFVPVLNYLLMAVLCLLPKRPARSEASSPPRREGKLPSALLSIAAGVGVDLGMFVLSVYGMRDYGLALFVGTPFVAGIIGAYIYNRRYAATERETMEMALLTTCIMVGVLFTVGYEGAICLAMALPLGMVIGVFGALVGRAIALRDDRSPWRSLLALVLLPPAMPLFARPVSEPLHEVRSAIEIDAPPELVWPHVLSFPVLPEPPALVRRMGIAYPLRARIEGSGAGAVRYCEFSTGPFVEPIRVWDTARRLSFDVVQSPPPLREWSPYIGVAPPHLDGFFQARRGEFRLVRLPGNRTRLEGSTWYELRIAPEAYWGVFADLIVGRIHHRVLEHIATTTLSPL